MKKMLYLVSLLALLLVGCQNGSDTSKDGVLRVGMECGYAPFNWTDPNKNEDNVKIDAGLINAGYCDGYDVTMAKAIAEDLNLELKIKKIGWEGLITALQENQIDAIIAGMSPTEERMQQISFSNNYYSSEQVVIVRKNSEFAIKTKLSDFSGATLVSQLGTLQDRLIKEAKDLGIIHGTAYDSYPEAITALINDTKIDGVVAEYPVALSATASNQSLTIVRFEVGEGFHVDDEEVLVSIGVRKNDTDLLNKINAALDKISLETREEWMLQAINRQP
jgi:putative lysine transport system substrate-binding protein